MQRGRYAEAVQLLAPLAAADPRDADLQYRLGLAQQRAGNIVAASNALTAAARLRPDEALYAAALARLFAGLPRYDRASFYYRKLLRLRPTNPALAEEAAAFMLAQGKPLEAELVLKQATVANPKSAELWLLLAQCYRTMKLSGEEAKCLQRAISLKPLQTAQIEKLIDLYWQAGQPDRALPYLQMAQRQDPGNVTMAVRLAECYLALRDTRAAIAAYRQVVKLAPRHMAYRLALAALLIETDPRAALREYDAVFSVQQASPEQLLTAAALAAKTTNPAAARRYISWLVALRPQELEPRERLIDAALEGHDVATALVQWRELQRAGQPRAALEEADLALKLGGREWALARLQEVADTSARDPALQARLASMFRQLHDAPRAAVLARAALAGTTDNGDDTGRATRLLAATVLLQCDQPTEAEPVFRAVLQREPGHPAASRELARCAVARGDARGGWEQLRDLMLAHPRDLETMQALLEAAEAAGEWEATARHMRELLTANPDNAVLIDGLCELYHRQGGPWLAATRLAELADWEPRKGLISLTAARELAAVGRRQEAAALYERLSRGSDYMSAARVGLVYVLLAQGRYAELLAALTRLTGPQDIGAEPYRLLLAVRGETSLQTGAALDLAAVARAAAEVALAPPQSESYYMALADLYLAVAQGEAGLKFLEAEAGRKQTESSAAVGIGRLLRRMGRAPEALAWLSQDVAPSSASLLERAQCLLQTGQTVQAGLIAEQILRPSPTGLPTAALLVNAGDPTLADAHLVAAEACAVGYRPEEALWHFVRAIMTGAAPQTVTIRISALCTTQPLGETAVLNALQQLYAAGFCTSALTIADALVAKPGFGKLRAWALQRALEAEPR